MGLLWRGPLARLVSAQIAMLVVGTFAGILWFHNAPTVGHLSFGLPTLRLPAVSWELLLTLLEPAFTMAIITSVGTLVTALRTDMVTEAYHKPDREIVSHGSGNILAGLIGGLPGSVSVVSFNNIGNGGRTPVSGIVAALVLLLLAFGVSRIGQGIPYACST